MKPILTPRQFAESIGVSESSVKRWVDDGHIAATRTAGGHRRIALREAARYVREHGVVVVRPDILGLDDLESLGSDSEQAGDAGERLFEFLKSGAAAEARGLILSRYLAGDSVAEIVDGPVSHAMSRIGELWVSSSSGIFREHRATQIAIQAMIRMRLLLAPAVATAAAVGAAPAGDRYILPSLAAAAVLEGEGFRAVDLGPETPIASLARGVEEIDPQLVWLSVSVAADVDRLRREIRELVPRLADRGALIVVGGAQAAKLALPRSESLYVGRSMAELEALVRGMRLAPPPAGG